jgi:hypothetical protein
LFIAPFDNPREPVHQAATRYHSSGKEARSMLSEVKEVVCTFGIEIGREEVVIAGVGLIQ